VRLRVLLHGRPVGVLEQVSGRWAFTFDEAYLTRSERPVLGRWFEDRLVRDPGCYGIDGGLPAFFQNYLPEQGTALRALLATQNGVDPQREGHLLLALADDLPGALEVRREGVGAV
jgi:serine/threonine-protein kinase HipA